MNSGYTTLSLESSIPNTYNTTDWINTTVSDGRTVNIENNDFLISTASNMAISVVVGILMIFGSIGNILTLLVIYKNKFLQIPSNYFIVSLCISDLISALLCSPLWLYKRTWGFLNWEWGLGACQVYWIFDFTTDFATATHILTFSIARFIAIKHPFAVSSLNKRKVQILIAFLWLSSLLLTIPLLWWMGVDNFRSLNPIGKNWPSCSILVKTNVTCCVTQYNYYMTVVGPLLFFIPEILVIVLSISIVKAMLGRRKWMKGFANVYNVTEQVQRVNSNSSTSQTTVNSKQTECTSTDSTTSNDYDFISKKSVQRMSSKILRTEDNSKEKILNNPLDIARPYINEEKLLTKDDLKKALQNEKEKPLGEKNINSNVYFSGTIKSSYVNLAFLEESKNNFESELHIKVKCDNQDTAISADVHHEISEINPKEVTIVERNSQTTKENPNQKQLSNRQEKKVKIIVTSDSETKEKYQVTPCKSTINSICEKDKDKDKKFVQKLDEESKGNNNLENIQNQTTIKQITAADNRPNQEANSQTNTCSNINVAFNIDSTDSIMSNKSLLFTGGVYTNKDKAEDHPQNLKSIKKNLFPKEVEKNNFICIKSQSFRNLQTSKRNTSRSFDHQKTASGRTTRTSAKDEEKTIYYHQGSTSFKTIKEESEASNHSNQTHQPSGKSAPTSLLQPPPNPILYHRKESTISFSTDQRNRSFYRQQPRRPTAASERSDNNPNRRGSSASIALERQARQERATFIQLTLVNVSFLIGYIPITVYLLWTSNVATGSRDPFTDYWFGVVSYLCLRVSECMNPVIYNLASSNIGGATRKMLREIFACKRDT